MIMMVQAQLTGDEIVPEHRQERVAITGGDCEALAVMDGDGRLVGTLRLDELVGNLRQPAGAL